MESFAREKDEFTRQFLILLSQLAYVDHPDSVRRCIALYMNFFRYSTGESSTAPLYYELEALRQLIRIFYTVIPGLGVLRVENDETYKSVFIPRMSVIGFVYQQIQRIDNQPELESLLLIPDLTAGNIRLEARGASGTATVKIYRYDTAGCGVSPEY